jgi:signal transduction histidine kinase
VTTPVDPDQQLLRSATRRMAWQLAAASAVVVVLAALATLALSPVLGHGRGGHDGGIDRDDDVLRTTLLVAGTIGVVIAGVTGLLIARRAVAPLAEALSRQRRFVADAGHELRTPLTVMHTRAQLIARRMSPEDPALPAMRQLLDDSRTLGEIVDELLASAQLSADPGRGESVDVRDLLCEVARSMTVLADQRAIALTVSASDDARVNGSHTALRRALAALVDNAIGHTPAGGTVDLAARVTGDRVVLSVTDTGEGLDGADPDELTQRFARGPRSADGPGGRRFGLGLALVREVATAHGGALRLGPGPVGGVRAEIEIPTAAG